MAADWNLIRTPVAAGTGACGAIETAGDGEAGRDRTFPSLHDLTTGAQVLPEALGDRVIRERHERGANAADAPEAARIAEACSELVRAARIRPAQAKEATHWDRRLPVPRTRRAPADSARA